MKKNDPPLCNILGTKTSSKELTIRPDYNLVNFNEERRKFLKISYATAIVSGTLILSPQKANAGLGLIIILIIILSTELEAMYEDAESITVKVAELEGGAYLYFDLSKYTGHGDFSEFYLGNDADSVVDAEPCDAFSY